MHDMVNYLLFIALAILPLLQLIHNNNNNTNNPIMVDARKLTTQKNIFSVELIHRNSSKNGPRDRSLSSISRNPKIKLLSRFYNSKTVQSIVSPDGGNYNMKISIGTPPVEFTATMDTGSDLIWVQCSPCQSCLPQQSALFDPTQSSTHKILPCTSQLCDRLQLGLTAAGCGSNDNSCHYQADYGGGNQTTGLLSAETVTFLSTSISDVVFGCGNNQKVQLTPHSNGIVGLGGGPLSLVSQLGPNIDYKFSYCLTPRTSGISGKLNFGLDVKGPGPVTSTPFVQKDTPPTLYYVTLDSIIISYNFGATLIPVNNFIVVDSGTTLTYLPLDVYDTVRTVVMDSIALTPVNSPSPHFDLCYQTDSLDGLNFPGLVFGFSGGDVTLKAENSFAIGDGVACFAMGATDDPPYVFGNYAQTNFHVGFDLQAKRVSFASADCTNF